MLVDRVWHRQRKHQQTDESLVCTTPAEKLAAGFFSLSRSIGSVPRRTRGENVQELVISQKLVYNVSESNKKKVKGITIYYSSVEYYL